MSKFTPSVLNLQRFRGLRSLLIFGGAIAPLSVLSACGPSSPPRLSTSAVEAKVAKSFQAVEPNPEATGLMDKYRPSFSSDPSQPMASGLTVKSVTCPKEMLAEKGKNYSCEATVSIGGIETKSTMVIFPAGNGTEFESQISKVVLLGESLEAQFKQGLKEKVPPETSLAVKCPQEMLAQKDKTYDCTVKIGDEEPRQAIVTMTSNRGAYKMTMN